MVALFSATLINFDLSCWFCCSAVNKCSLKPCFPFVKCEETPGVGLGFSCGDCPPGYSGDGLRCDDVDEVNFICCIFFFFFFLVLESLANTRYIKWQQSQSVMF